MEVRKYYARRQLVGLHKPAEVKVEFAETTLADEAWRSARIGLLFGVC